MKKIIFILVTLSASLNSLAIELYTEFPTTINPNERYVFYSHGLIVEGDNPRPEHPEYGIYEFAEIKSALFEGGGFNLIAHHRLVNTDIDSYAETLEGWVQRLLDAGVQPSRVTLIGFSRGSHLTAFASNKLNETGINTALLASCMEGDIPFGPQLNLGDHLLSIYETSDTMGTCATLESHSSNLSSFKEIAISTGLTHGAFFQPLPEWVEPLKEWLRETNR
ncbi:MAG: alpha/beta hydrolase [SAR86 cluster bacterium]|uniref:Alpha/beta hydrolase n=1 Tax=SAR86 cluster bacterium TaxID=2030880 RepID=A0A2A5CFY5_9GAMM|nr:MAG: alpha/beta hydrolase [SAR86 cluster bacterium]